MNSYLNQDFLRLLQANELEEFKSLWELKLSPVDEPNTDRGGHSEVARLSLSPLPTEANIEGVEGVDVQVFFIKRQYHHLTRSLRYPLGEPTFRRELRNILLYQKNNIASLDPVFYAEQDTSKGLSSILITRALLEYKPLSDFTADWTSLSEHYRQKLLQAAATLIGGLHAKGIFHRCCYPKHLFINLELSPPVRFIDLENARCSFFKVPAAINDLDAFIHRFDILNEGEIGCFLRAYQVSSDIGLSADELKRRLQLRRAKKAKRKSKKMNEKIKLK